jgi:hypothetical protein
MFWHQVSFNNLTLFLPRQAREISPQDDDEYFQTMLRETNCCFDLKNVRAVHTGCPYIFSLSLLEADVMQTRLRVLT